MATEIIRVPDIGSSDKVTIIEVAVQEGDTVAVDDTLIVLESDKASMDIPAPTAGKVTKLVVKVDDQIGEGDEILYLEVEGASEAESASNEASAPEPTAAPAESAKAPSTSSIQNILVPDIGGDDGVTVIEVSVNVGDQIEVDDTLITLESDKASMEIPATLAGEVVAVRVKVDDKVSEGDLIVEVKAADGGVDAPTDAKASPAPSPAPAPAAPAVAQPSPNQISTPTYVGSVNDDNLPSKAVHAGPAVRMLAREFGVDLAVVPGTGPKGRILKQDVANYVKARLRAPVQATAGAGIPSIPDQDFSKFGNVEVKEMSRIQQLTAQNMTRNWLNIPHVTQFDEADVTELEAFRASLKAEAEKRGTKLSPLAFIVKACAAALVELPNFNVSLLSNGKELVQKHYVNIGVAVDSPNGLMVPVIRDADKKSVWQIAEEIIELAGKARKGQLKAADMQGGCFTISSLGGIGGTAFTPIVNAPEVAILGVSKSQVKPVWNGKEFVPRTMLPLSLSYDHRAINGADGAKFTNFLVAVLSDLRRLVL